MNFTTENINKYLHNAKCCVGNLVIDALDAEVVGNKSLAKKIWLKVENAVILIDSLSCFEVLGDDEEAVCLTNAQAEVALSSLVTICGCTSGDCNDSLYDDTLPKNLKRYA